MSDKDEVENADQVAFADISAESFKANPPPSLKDAILAHEKAGKKARFVLIHPEMPMVWRNQIEGSGLEIRHHAKADRNVFAIHEEDPNL